LFYTVCNVTYNGSMGFINSPNFPQEYGINNLDCYYFIDVGYNRVNLTFTAFSTETNYDFVEVKKDFFFQRISYIIYYWYIIYVGL